ncbi:metal-dependent hydrolase [Dendrosporobacter sp. 1207_IL3150]|uniref:metal-dependent hydrolase n=1 Tax=Dendrosporobacter sp. 1207_IL3150 TaxID=3084054 RepID=UPI002FD884F9
MDTLSHALIGIAVAGLSGHQPAIDNPIYIAAVLGAQAPDFDIIAQLRGSFAYIRQHRAFSHSLPGVVLLSILLTGGIHLFYPQANIVELLFWAFAGGLSHIIIDYFNTHGTSVLWPIRRERKSCKLLNVFDPILIIAMLALFLPKLTPKEHSLITFLFITIYILVRIYLRTRAARWLRYEYANQAIFRVEVMPSLKRLLFWDFVIETSDSFIIGQIGALHPKLEQKLCLPKNQNNSNAALYAQKTTVGDFFNSFSPLIYIEETQHDNIFRVNIYDLRYLINKQFRHSATVVFDKNLVPIDAYLLSYGRKIKVPS